MNISSTSSLTPVTSLSSTSAASRVAPTDPDAQTDAATSVAGGSDQTKLSKLGQLFSKLQDLENTDPAKAKQVLTSIASSLSAKASANGTTDPRLQQLADKFTQAASTGDLSGLKPTGHAGHGHGGHGDHDGHGPGGPEGGPPPAASTGAGAASTGAASTGAASAASSSSKTQSYRQSADNPLAQLESIMSNALGTTTAATA